MSDEAEAWRAFKLHKQEKRASNRQTSAELLAASGIVFTSHNNGAHLIVEGPTTHIDFWPGPGRWNCRTGKKSFGVMGLIQYVKKGQP
jgi:hypothetical protein